MHSIAFINVMQQIVKGIVQSRVADGFIIALSGSITGLLPFTRMAIDFSYSLICIDLTDYPSLVNTLKERININDEIDNMIILAKNDKLMRCVCIM